MIIPIKNTLLIFFIGAIVLSCNQEQSCSDCKDCQMFKYDDNQALLNEAVIQYQSDSLSGITNRDDLAKSMKVITQKYGEQWDFCDCVVKGDSLDKALKNEKLSDQELDKLLKRFDEIDKKCQAFKIIDPSRTPKERAIHEKKVKKCLKQNGIY
jgi:hypothetical protein